MKNRLKQIRKAKGASQVFIAKQANVTPSYLSQVEAGLYTPGMENGLKIAKALDVTVEDIWQEGEL